MGLTGACWHGVGVKRGAQAVGVIRARAQIGNILSTPKGFMLQIVCRLVVYCFGDGVHNFRANIQGRFKEVCTSLQLPCVLAEAVGKVTGCSGIVSCSPGTFWVLRVQ